MKLSDFDRYADLWADAALVGQIGVAPFSRVVAWDSFLRNAGHWQLTGFGQWAIEPHRAGRMAGQVGFFHAARGYGEDFDSYPEAGWMLSPDAHGQGFGPEAAGAAHDWFDRVVTGPLVCRVAPGNERSLRLAAALGYKDMREEDGRLVLLRKSPPQGAMA